MALRRRHKRTDRSKIDATPPWETRLRDEPEQTTGPYDVRDEPEDGLARIDLGALRVPVMAGVDVRLDLDEAQQIVSVTLANADGQMQLGVFAAPRAEGIWDDVRAELRNSLSVQRGSSGVREDGPFGIELVGRLPGEGGEVPVRFVGVDGPRWFLRAMFLGRAALDDAVAAPFDDALRNVVVVRGSEPLPVRDPVPLTMPADVTAEPAVPGADAGESARAENEPS